MTSNRQIEANRGNAKRSTGPKTEAGKIRSSRNSLRHGLSRPTASGSDCEIRAMAHEALTKRPDLIRTKLELTRIRYARGALLAAFLKSPNPKLAKALVGIDRYERKAFARQRRLLRGHAEPADVHKTRQPSIESAKNGGSRSPTTPEASP
jgi:hypothetical protein